MLMNITTSLVKSAALTLFAVSALTVSPAMAGTSKSEEPVIVVATTTPAAVVTHKIKHATTSGDCTKYATIIGQYDWPVATAMQICKDESQGDPGAINWSDKHYDRNGNLVCVSSRGLFQVGCFWPASLGFTRGDLVDPEKNVAMAYEIWLKEGFSPWTTYKGA